MKNASVWHSGSIRWVVGGALLAAAALMLFRSFAGAPPRQQPVAAAISAKSGDQTGSTSRVPSTPENLVPDTEATLPAAPLVRDVTPDGIARVYAPAQATTQRGSSRPIRIARAAVTPNGAITGDGTTVKLYGVVFPESKKICSTVSGERWPCGRRAFIGLHNKVIGQAVSCAPRGGDDPPAGDCFLGEVNLAAWLLSQGLTRLAPDIQDKDLLAAEAAARKAKLGLWADPRETPPGSAAQRR
jgi:endonuclease YncB( thermonuclease family)